jgi:hypothetical protein
MTNKQFERNALSEQTVLHTWSGILQNEHLLTDNWIKHSGVLVGMILWSSHGSNMIHHDLMMNECLSPTLSTAQGICTEMYFPSGGPYLWEGHCWRMAITSPI